MGFLLKTKTDPASLLRKLPGAHYSLKVPFGWLTAVDGARPHELCPIPKDVAVLPNRPITPAGLFFREDFIPIGTEDVWRWSGGEEAEAGGYDGSESTVAVIDTGALTMHRSFMRRDVKFAGDLFGVDGSGHGTLCASIINSKRTLAPIGNVWCRGMSNAKVFAVRGLYGLLGSATTMHVIEAMNLALKAQSVDIVSMSLGGIPYPNPNDDPLVLMAHALIDAGKTVVVARGNDPHDYTSPGVSDRVITVGSWSRTDNAPAWFSKQILGRPAPSWSFGGGRADENAHPNERIVGPTSLIGSIRRWTTSAGFLPRGRVAGFAGTSMATPVIAGLIALLNSVSLRKNGRKLRHDEAKMLLGTGGPAKFRANV